MARISEDDYMLSGATNARAAWTIKASQTQVAVSQVGNICGIRIKCECDHTASNMANGAEVPSKW